MVKQNGETFLYVSWPAAALMYNFILNIIVQLYTRHWFSMYVIYMIRDVH